MGTIKILPDNVVAKIAAGEVVERPSSVVKELLDNAIDAGATSIEVDVSCGGKISISVIDNGCGMDEQDACSCIKRHATSKISSDDDLFGIKTMGFRGEALSAIAAVSKMQIETKSLHPLPSGEKGEGGNLEGTFISVEGGVLKEVRPAGCPPGTRVLVKELFFNVPARKKFLKSDAVEYGHVVETVSTLALADSNRRFELSQDGFVKISCYRTGDARARIEDVLGEDVRGSLVEFRENGHDLDLAGFIVRGGITRATPKDIYFFVNGRPVKDRILQHALFAGFETILPRGVYPIAVLYLKMDPADVDVNVHPTKREVRFANSGLIHDFVAAAARKAVASRSPAEAGVRLSSAEQKCRTPLTFEVTHPPEWGRLREGVNTPPLVPSHREREENPLRILGQLDNAFIVCEGENGRLVLIDQHAAHERLGFETLKQQWKKGSIEQQRLLLPEQLKLSPKESAVILEYRQVIENAGFELEPFGGGSFVVKAVPSLLGEVSLQMLFEKITSEFFDFESSGIADEAVEKIFSVIACHRQVRAGDVLSLREMESLVRDVENEGVTHCPHGRPAIVQIEKSEIEKWFKRRG